MLECGVPDIHYSRRRQDHALKLVDCLLHPVSKHHQPVRHANAGWINLSWVTLFASFTMRDLSGRSNSSFLPESEGSTARIILASETFHSVNSSFR